MSDGEKGFFGALRSYVEEPWNIENLFKSLGSFVKMIEELYKVVEDSISGLPSKFFEAFSKLLSA